MHEDIGRECCEAQQTAGGPGSGLAHAFRRRADTDFVIELTRLNGHPITVNCDLIRSVEASPDTLLSLVTGEKLLVRETCRDVAQIAFAYRAAVLRAAWPDAAGALIAAAAAFTLQPDGSKG